jgi:hypothetical protein
MTVSKFPTSFRYLAGSEINSQRSLPICLMKERISGSLEYYGVGVRQAERWALEPLVYGRRVGKGNRLVDGREWLRRRTAARSSEL